MKIILEIILIIIIFIFLIYILYIKKQKNQLNQQIIDLNNKINQKKEQYLNELKKDNSNLFNNFEIQIKLKQNELSSIKQNISDAKIALDELYNTKERDIEKIINEKELRLNQQLEYKKLAINTEIEEWARSNQDAINFRCKQLEQQINTLEKSRASLEETLLDLSKRQEAANQEILRRRAIEENQDFYRIQLDSISIKDINVLNSIRSNLTKIDILDKLIYDNYIKKPTDEMIKRVLQGKSPCGIYKITRLKTSEIYIGQSTDVKARWQQHTKSAFHCGTISHSILHTTMERDGIVSFTWELLEEVPKDQLTKREKYWINFYGSKQYGLNEKE